MGTDIHARVQYHVESTIMNYRTGKEEPITYWRTIHPPSWWPRDEFVAKRIAEEEAAYIADPTADNLETLTWYRQEWIAGRNYNLFAILADVRNGRGFAGVETGEPWPSIAPERGLPDDCDEDDTSYPSLGDHSFTWMTLAELFAFDWHGTSTTAYGVVPLAEYTPGVPPKQWSGAVWGRNIVTVDERDLDGFRSALGMEIYVRQAWQWTAAQACRWFVEHELPAFQRLCDTLKKDPTEVRLVLGFDS